MSSHPSGALQQPTPLPVYRPPVGGYDEMCQPDGEVRSHWAYLSRALSAMGVEALQGRLNEARRLLRDNGVTYSAYDDPEESQRAWELDPIPLLIASEEWRGIERGLLQRAELFRLLLADLYGPREVLRRGLVPAELIYAQPGFLRPCDRMLPPDGRHWLPLYAADLQRLPDGSFTVVEDRSQAPPGVGYALENRIVLSRVFPSLFRDAQVHRLALFFRTFRTTLLDLAWRDPDQARMVMLTPGPDSGMYFEHAFLAKYLGYTLVQGADLTVRDARVWLKTLDGLQPVDVILRFLEDGRCDPLELHPDGSGPAGLLQALRLRQVAVANPPGSGVVENPALKAYLPGLARHLLGEDLLLPSPESYWCGDPTARRHVLAHLNRLIIRTVMPGASSEPVQGNTLSRAGREQLRARILQNPGAYMAQEAQRSATVPAFTGSALTPHRLMLRSFLVATETDYMAMPGGLARISADGDHPLLPVQSGGVSKDTWVLASEPQRKLSLVSPTVQLAAVSHGHGELPSRVAENLFWLGRYAERAEGVIRLLRAVLAELLQPDEEYLPVVGETHLQCLLQAVTHLTETYPGFVGEEAEARLAQPDEELFSVFLDRRRPGSLAYTLNALLFAARAVRDRISPDIWRVFNEIEEGLKLLQNHWAQRRELNGSSAETLNPALDELNHLLTTCVAFTGLAMDSMVHGQGWRFLMIGRRLERGQQTMRLLRLTLCQQSTDEPRVLEALLRILDSLMTYRSRYRTQVEAAMALTLLVQDETNPRSLGYQLKHLEHDLQTLPQRGDSAYASAERRLALEAMTLVRLADSNRLAQLEKDRRPQLDQLLARLSHLLPGLSDAITNSYFSHAEAPQQLVPLGGD